MIFQSTWIEISVFQKMSKTRKQSVRLASKQNDGYVVSSWFTPEQIYVQIYGGGDRSQLYKLRCFENLTVTIFLLEMKNIILEFLI